MEPKWFELEGDYSRLHKTYINADYDGPSYPTINSDQHATAIAEFEHRQNELNNLVYDDKGKHKVTFLPGPTKDWDFFVECGFIP